MVFKGVAGDTIHEIVYKDFVCLGSSKQELFGIVHGKPNIMMRFPGQDYFGTDDDVELRFIPGESGIEKVMKAFDKCNMLHVDSASSEDEEDDVIYTKEYFDKLKD